MAYPIFNDYEGQNYNIRNGANILHVLIYSLVTVGWP